MYIVLIGNYPPDKQESMQRFADMLYEGFKQQKLRVEIWLPGAVFGKRAKSTTAGYGKWFGYIDKWILFPLVLRRRVLQKKYRKHSARFHICDHSNAPYLAHLPTKRTSITCHDVLAIRGAMGYEDAYCPASPYGKILQHWILKNLLKAQRLAAVSQLTLEQLQDVAKVKGMTKIPDGWQVIHNAFNSPFYVMDKEEQTTLLQQAGVDTTAPFILHVGSTLPRKNRRMLIDMVAHAGDAWTGNIVFAGQAMGEELMTLANRHQIAHRVISIVHPNHPTLVALYNACSAFVFPSFSEGFGWPVIEAQACGAPVIASTLPPLPEVSGGAALHANPNKPESFSKALLTLQDEDIRKKIIGAGFKNIQRFEPCKMIEQYKAIMQIDSNTV